MVKEHIFRGTPVKCNIIFRNTMTMIPDLREPPWLFLWPHTDHNFVLSLLSPSTLALRGKEKKVICLSLEAVASLPRQLSLPGWWKVPVTAICLQEYDRKACIAASAEPLQSHSHELFSVVTVGWALLALLPLLLGQPRDKEIKIRSF